jgi:hypothetical protein
MTPVILKARTGRCGYARITTVLLLGAGVAAFATFLYKGADDRDTGMNESLRQHMELEARLLQELGKSRNRSFSDEQVALMKKELSPLKGECVAIECPMGDLQACYLALEINLVFEASGWIVEEFLFAVQRTSGEAVILRVKDESMMDRAKRLSLLFGSVGVPVTTQIDTEQLFNLKILVPAKGPQA